VVFHPASGDVHLLSAAAAALLRALESEPATLTNLIETLDLPGPDGDERDLRAHLADTMAAFDRAGLIEPARP
jgi:PqqD family protein of HPr-rel-A system